jgi:hypothetical protein
MLVRKKFKLLTFRLIVYEPKRVMQSMYVIIQLVLLVSFSVPTIFYIAQTQH